MQPTSIIRTRRALVVAVALVVATLATSCQPGPGTPVMARPTLGTVVCPNGAKIFTNVKVTIQVRKLVLIAYSKGVSLCGSSYRDPSNQIALRRRNCGSSTYAIYQMPASKCSPATAIPGRSMHESGLAVDFTPCSTRATACYRWLAANARSFGLYNLPSEPWHWSTNGA